MQVCLIGSAIEDDQLNSLAYEAGKLIAYSGHVCVCGGRTGVMAAASKGAKEAGGLTVGILPGTDKKDANPYVDIVIPTGMGHARNHINILAADLVIAIGGGPGTLSEISFALIHSKPLLLYSGKGASSWEDRFRQLSPSSVIRSFEGPEVLNQLLKDFS